MGTMINFKHFLPLLPPTVDFDRVRTCFLCLHIKRNYESTLFLSSSKCLIKYSLTILLFLSSSYYYYNIFRIFNTVIRISSNIRAFYSRCIPVQCFWSFEWDFSFVNLSPTKTRCRVAVIAGLNLPFSWPFFQQIALLVHHIDQIIKCATASFDLLDHANVFCNML